MNDTLTQLTLTFALLSLRCLVPSPVFIVVIRGQLTRIVAIRMPILGKIRLTFNRGLNRSRTSILNRIVHLQCQNLTRWCDLGIIGVVGDGSKQHVQTEQVADCLE
jgi:hypothetical protein